MKLLDKIPKIEGDELFEYHEVIGSRIYENVFRLSRKIVLKKFRLEFPELANKAEEEISKARKIGFNPGADALMPYNLRLSENNKLFLIDFGLWNHNEVPVHPLRDSYDFSKIQSPQSAFPE